MRLIGMLAIVLSFGVTVFAQVAPTPSPGRTRGSSVIGDNAGYERLRSIEMINAKNRNRDHPLLDPKTGIYRRPGKEETQVLAVETSVLAKYSAFLKEPNTGVVKFSAAAECVSDTDTVVAVEKCLPYKIPGAGIAYSFRTESYRLPRLADLILHEGVFKTGGVFQQVVIVDLGDLTIEDVSIETRGMKYLTEYKPVKNSDEFTRNEEEIINGIEHDGFLYRKGQLVKENVAYGLRSIAYRGKYIRSIDGVAYDELELDKRRDVIVAFRVVGIDPAGNVTIVWKRLRDVEAPKLKVIK